MLQQLQARVLERVLGIGRSQTRADTELTLLSLEMYDDGFILNYRVRGTDLGEWAGLAFIFAPPIPNAPFAATDDKGARYIGMPWGGSGGPGGDWRGDVHFTPKVTEGAKELVIRVEQVHWSGFGQSQKSRVELGPWEFVVPLT
jgi:hypothetical protein